MYSVSVVIPSYNRPDFLRKAILSITSQTWLPMELVVVLRESDFASHQVVSDIEKCAEDLPIRVALVTEPGFLPPIYKGAEAASGDIVAFVDDDAEAHENWLEKLLPHYNDPTVGGVGGRYVNYFDGKKAYYPPAKTVGQITWYGKPIGNLYRDTNFLCPRDVQFLIGGNMSYRLALFRQALPDRALGRHVAFHWEIDVGLNVQRRGHRIVFDPSIRVDHHSAPRAQEGMRSVNAEGIYWSNFNYAYLMRTHLARLRFVAYLVYTTTIGWSDSPGFLRMLVGLIRLRPLSISDVLWPSIRGRLAGLRRSRILTNK